MKFGIFPAACLAVLLHIVIIVALLLNIDLSKPEKPEDLNAGLMHANWIDLNAMPGAKPGKKAQSNKRLEAQRKKQLEEEQRKVEIAKAQEEQRQAEAENRRSKRLKKRWLRLAKKKRRQLKMNYLAN